MVVKFLVDVIEVHLIIYLEVLVVLFVGVARGDGQTVFYAAVCTVVGILKVEGVGEEHVVGVVALAVEEAVFGVEKLVSLEGVDEWRLSTMGCVNAVA